MFFQFRNAYVEEALASKNENGARDYNLGIYIKNK